MKTHIKILSLTVASAAVLIACSVAPTSTASSNQDSNNQNRAQAVFVPNAGSYQEAIVAGGCFWCVESDFEKLDGVKEVVSGYTGGTLDNPKYKQVGTNQTGHYEAAIITFDPAVVTYRELIDHYWETVDPTDDGGQFCDRGASYRTAIFATPEQRAEAEASKAVLVNSGRLSKRVVTPILDAVTFYDAEDYHQDYYKKSSVRYKYYRNGCGRDRTLAQLWGK